MKKVKISQRLNEAFEVLIPIYKSAIEYECNNKSLYWSYLHKSGLSVGICNATSKILNFYSYDEMEYIGRQLGYNFAWFETPQKEYSVKENKKLLKFRLEIMKKLIK